MKPLYTLIDVEYMHDYRILSDGTMRRLSLAQSELIDLQKRSAAGEAPNAAELEALMWRFAEVIRSIDWADKFLVVQGQPAGRAGRYEKLRRQWLPQVAHRPLSSSTNASGA